MNKSLRDEIETILHRVWGDVESDGGSDIKEHSNEILKLIEKRIDSRIKQLHFLDDAVKIHELKKVKEMLK